MPDYSFYVNEFLGEEIDGEEEFLRLGRKAEKYLESIIGGEFDKNDSECFDAVCAVAEAYKKYADRDGIASESADGYSVSYEKRAGTELYDAAKLYLPKRLLYRGI
ncbi:MAG: hypothetical protein PUB42_04975 [Firmicutes bacterium]|nr:hypothetical protein [Bacillota bacterium]